MATSPAGCTYAATCRRPSAPYPPLLTFSVSLAVLDTRKKNHWKCSLRSLTQYGSARYGAAHPAGASGHRGRCAAEAAAQGRPGWQADVCSTGATGRVHGSPRPAARRRSQRASWRPPTWVDLQLHVVRDVVKRVADVHHINVAAVVVAARRSGGEGSVCAPCGRCCGTGLALQAAAVPALQPAGSRACLEHSSRGAAAQVPHDGTRGRKLQPSQVPTCLHKPRRHCGHGACVLRHPPRHPPTTCSGRRHQQSTFF